jgi:RNA ligase
MNTELLKEMISNNYIKVNKHPEHDLFIYNYTAKAQYDRVWNEITLMCRGLILDVNDTIIARPFPKFFNFGESENQELPVLPFEVYDKMDGSLGISYFVNDIPFTASRRSFTSEQAAKAKTMLHEKHRNSWGKLDSSKTYVFEIIYPESRIIVNYETKEKLVLIAVIHTQSARNFRSKISDFPLDIKKYDLIDKLAFFLIV